MPVQYIPKPIRANVRDEIGNRHLNTGGADHTHVYQNTTLRPVLVVVVLACISAGAGVFCRGIGQVGPTTPPGSTISYGGWQVSPGGGEHGHWTCIVMVPPGWYYQFYRDIGIGEQVEINEWWEVDL